MLRAGLVLSALRSWWVGALSQSRLDLPLSESVRGYERISPIWNWDQVCLDSVSISGSCSLQLEGTVSISSLRIASQVRVEVWVPSWLFGFQ